MIAIIIIVVKGIMSRSDPTSPYSLTPKVILKLKSGQRNDIETNIVTPEDIIQVEMNSGRKFVRRKKGFLDKGNDKIYLDKYMQFHYEGWDLIIDDVDEISNKMYRLYAVSEEEKKALKNRLAVTLSENARLQNKLQESTKIRIDEIGEFNKQLPFFPSQKKK